MSVAGKPKKKKKKGAPEYMLTYGDMVTLLLTFFVAMFSMGEADPREMRLILSAFSGSLGMFSGGQTLTKGQLVEMGMSIESLPSKQKGSSLARSKRKAQEVLKPEIRSKQVRVREDERGITISLSADSFFKPGSAELELDKAGDLLDKVSKLVNNQRVKNQIRVEGHTDNTPVAPGSPFRSNWELSTARAMSVLRYMTGQGVDEERFEVAGYAQYQPLEKGNDTPEKRAYNRRVDIVLLRE